MRIVFHARHQRLAVLEKTSLALWDLTTGTPVLRATTPVRNGDNANGCDAWVGVLAGKVAPAGASIRAATLHRFDWDLTALPSPVLGEVARHTLSPSADGAWVAATNWKNGRVTVFDAATGAVRGANGSSIPSGPSFSPDGLTLLAGAADQGSGAVLAFDLTAVNDGTLSMSQLSPPGRGHPGLDDAPFFSVFSRDGRYAALSNESWGGRGVCVYDMSGRAPARRRRSARCGPHPSSATATTSPLFVACHARLLARRPLRASSQLATSAPTNAGSHVAVPCTSAKSTAAGTAA